MSIVYSDTSTKKGLLQIIERNCGFKDAEVSGDATLKAAFTAEINMALDEVLAEIFSVGGTWQFDDTNHSTSNPAILTNIVSGTATYALTADSDNNLSLEIYKVFCADENGLYRELTPVDIQSNAPANYTDGLNVQGQPNTYDKTGKWITLDPIPNYNYTNGLKVFISREGSYFTTSETTKKPGFAGIFHELLALIPSYKYARDKGLQNVARLEKDIAAKMDALRNYYKAREKDVQKTLRPRRNCSR